MKTLTQEFTDQDAPALAEPIDDDTRFLITDAGLDALRLAPIVPDADDLDAPLTADDTTTDTDDAFTPDTADKADWVLGKIADHRARAARIRENMELMAREADQAAAFLEWKFGPALQAFTRAQTEGGKKKSVRLPNGVLGYRTKPASVTIGDTAAALEWARVNLPAAVVESVDRKAVTDALKETGEAVPFAAFIQSEEVFYIK